MWKTFIEKILKSEFFVTVLGIIAAALSAKLGIPEDSLMEFFLSVTGMVTTYTGGRSWAKSSEAKASAVKEAAKANPL